MIGLSASLIPIFATACAQPVSDRTPSRSVSRALDIQGHRGARGEMPENTVPAFLHAARLGVTTLEMDVVVTVDSQLVVSHEPWMSSHYCSHPDGRPVTEEEELSLNLFRMTHEEIRTFDCGSRGHALFPDQERMPVYKPLLGDVFMAIRDEVARSPRPPLLYNIETKSSPETDGVSHPDPGTFVSLLYSLLEAHGVLDRTTVQSFDIRTLQALHDLNPAVSTALLVGGSSSVDEQLGALGFTPTILSPDFRLVDRALVETAHSKRMKVIPWTINDSENMRRQVMFGVDGIITDYPTRALHALGVETSRPASGQ